MTAKQVSTDLKKALAAVAALDAAPIADARKPKLAEYGAGLLESLEPLGDAGDLGWNELTYVLLGTAALLHEVYSTEVKP